MVPTLHGEVEVILGFFDDCFKLQNIYLLSGILGSVSTDKVVDYKLAQNIQNNFFLFFGALTPSSSARAKNF